MNEEVFVLEQGRAGTGANPMDLWMQWYETSTKTWSDVFDGAQEGLVDPWGLYRQWFASMEEARDRMFGAVRSGTPDGMLDGAADTPASVLDPTGIMDAMGAAGAMESMDPQQMYRRWFEGATEAWQKSNQFGTGMLDFSQQWAGVLEQTGANMMKAEGGPPKDPVEFAVKWYNATSGPLGEFVQELLQKEDFLEPSSRFLQNYATFYKVFKKNSEEHLKTLQLPTRSDIARIATLVINLEDKVDRIEEAFEDFEDGSADFATNEAVESLQERVSSFEEKLDRLLSAADSSEAVNKTNADANEERIGRVEEKLDRISTAMEQSADTSATDELGGRLDQVESKLDQLIAILDQPSDTSATDHLDERVDRVEGKHDQLLTSLGDLRPDTTELDTASDTSASEANAPASAAGTNGGAAADNADVKATDAARRKAEELGVDLAEVEGTGTDGQMTVGDVRKKGES